MKDKFTKLTNTVYKVLEFFPESDPLKNRAKDKALSIMEHLAVIEETTGWASFQKEKAKAHLSEDIDILLGYLWIGKTQGWLNSVNCLIISNEYEKLRKDMAPIIELTQRLPGLDKPFINTESTQTTPEAVLDNESAQKEEASDSLISDPSAQSDRQAKILDFIIKNSKAQVMDLQTILPDVTKRTIRRDLDELIEAGKIVREGDFNQVLYRLKG